MMVPRTHALTRAGRLLAAVALMTVFFLPLGCGGKSRAPVVVIGLDGADWHLIVPWMEKGYLPHLKAFFDEASLGPLQVVYPILSPVCWTSAVTGVNPGKHGIFDFQKPAPDNGEPIIETATNRRALPIWLLLSDAGYKVGVLNVPMTYPPDPVRGKMISGFPFPDGDINIAYPPELKAKLHDYPLDRLGGMTLQGRTRQQLLDDFMTREDVRGRVAEDWISSGDYDFMWVVFTGPDKVQHMFWEDMDPNHPRHDPERAKKFGNAILDLWKKQDAIFGNLLAALPPDATVLVMSDHGFDGIYRQINLSTWVRKSGLPEWLKTHAVPPTMVTNGIVHYLVTGPLAGSSDREAFIDKFIDMAHNLKDPATGLCPFESVFRREDLYSGRMVEKAPDIVIQEIPKYYATTVPDSLDVPVFQDLWSPGFSAYHRPHGILAVRGPHIRASTSGSIQERLDKGGDFHDANIMDVTPTLLALMKQPVPDAMDGRVLTEAVTPEFLAQHPVVVKEVDGFLLDRIPDSKLSPEDLEKLRALPYLQ